MSELERADQIDPEEPTRATTVRLPLTQAKWLAAMSFDWGVPQRAIIAAALAAAAHPGRTAAVNAAAVEMVTAERSERGT